MILSWDSEVIANLDSGLLLKIEEAEGFSLPVETTKDS